jgi:N-hydroxyarylamine O-acetyltransferase
VASLDVSAYLRRLGLDCAPQPPSAAWLDRLHRAHVARVPYENVTIQLGRPHGIDAGAAVARVLGGAGGYCYQLNGAFGALLSALGFDVRRHVAGVEVAASGGPVGATGNHLALSVAGLPTDAAPDGVWLVDTGLGDGPAGPLPLHAGSYAQGPFRYAVTTSVAAPGGWRFEHDPQGSFVGFDMAGGVAAPGAFDAMHAKLSAAPDSPFVRRFVAQRRDAAGADKLVGCVLERVDAGGAVARDLTTATDWYAALADIFGLTLDDVTHEERRALFDRTLRAHEQWREVTA